MNSLGTIQTPSPQACPEGQAVDQPKVQVPDVVKYIALQRRAYSFTDLSDAELLREYQLIKEKKSKLPSSKRSQIKTIVLHAQASWQLDKQNGNLDRYNRLIEFLRIMGQFVDFIHSSQKTIEECYAIR